MLVEPDFPFDSCAVRYGMWVQIFTDRTWRHE